jgi:hypothetical protein
MHSASPELTVHTPPEVGMGAHSGRGIHNDPGGSRNEDRLRVMDHRPLRDACYGALAMKHSPPAVLGIMTMTTTQTEVRLPFRGT